LKVNGVAEVQAFSFLLGPRTSYLAKEKPRRGGSIYTGGREDADSRALCFCVLSFFLGQQGSALAQKRSVRAS
jgi:hypothetical protein